MGILIPCMQGISLIRGFTDNFNGKQDQGSIRRHTACGVSKPTQQANCQIKAAHSVFLLGCPRGAINFRQFPVDLLLSAEGVKAMVAVLLAQFLPKIKVFTNRPVCQFKDTIPLNCFRKPLNGFTLLPALIPFYIGQVRNFFFYGQDMKLMPVCQCILQFIYMAGHYGHDSGIEREIQEHIMLAQVKKLALPKFFLICDFLWNQFGF